MRGIMVGHQITVLKDYGSNINVLSKRFVQKFCRFLKLHTMSFSIQRSSRNSTETATEIVVNAKLQLGNHLYCSHCAVADCQYDILLAMA